MPAWLDGAWPVISDTATYGLAFVGAVMTIKPPAKTVTKGFYLAMIALLVGAGITANAKQRAIDQAKQDKLQQNETDARNQFSADLKDVKASSSTILNFVAHPPKGFTREQMVVLADFVESRQRPPVATPANPLVPLVQSTVDQLNVLYRKAMVSDNELRKKLTWIQYRSPEYPEMNAYERATATEAKPTMVIALTLEKQMLDILPGSKREMGDDKQTGLIQRDLASGLVTAQDLIDMATYLGTLPKRIWPSASIKIPREDTGNP